MERKTYGERMTTYDESAGLVFGFDLLEMGMNFIQTNLKTSFIWLLNNRIKLILLQHARTGALPIFVIWQPNILNFL